jgi:hypothetical protein
MLVRLGRYCRIRLFVFSEVPRSHEWYGVFGPIQVSIGPDIGPFQTGSFRHRFRQERQIVLPTKGLDVFLPEIGYYWLCFPS